MPILHYPYADRELRAVRLRLLRLRDELCLIRRDHWHRKYNPNQPRVPSGNAGGGQWTSGAGGGGGGSTANNPDLPGFASLDADTGWSSLSEGWNEDGSIFEQAVTDGQGTTIQSEYAASRAAGFDERQRSSSPMATRPASKRPATSSQSMPAARTAISSPARTGRRPVPNVMRQYSRHTLTKYCQ